MEELKEYLKSQIRSRKRAVEILKDNIPNNKIESHKEEIYKYERMLESLSVAEEKVYSEETLINTFINLMKHLPLKPSEIDSIDYEWIKKRI
jgi:predicted choloylglycine hydrolase